MILKDWKYVAMLFATIAGLVVPIWLSHEDLASHSASVKIISQTALQPDRVNEVTGLKISFEGQELISPYLTVLEISNDGTRPIPASDFESPIEIRALGSVKIVRAQISRTLPDDLQPKIALSNDVLKLQPLLLNANDSITVYFVTSGGKPKFATRGRIAGITSIKLEDNTQVTKSSSRFWLHIAAAFALQIGYFVAIRGVTPKSGFVIRRRALLFIAASSAFGSGIIVADVRKDIDLSTLQLAAFALALCFVAVLLAFRLTRNSEKARGYSPIVY